MDKLLKNIESSIAEFSNAQLFVAVSGGVDSMVLLNAIKILGHDPIALHVNYHLRGQESEGDELFIRVYCKTNNIKLFVKSIDLNEVLEKEGGNLQNKARTVRYNWFREVAERYDNGIVLLGQHENDQIETFILHLFRGAGMRGLSAMLKTRDIFVRPLLDCSREDILDFARSHNIEWREDSSNTSLKYSRNRLRNEFIPVMEEAVPSFQKDIIRLVKVFQENYLTTQKEAEKTVSDILKLDTINIDSVESWEDEFLIEVLRQLNIPIPIYEELKKLIHTENNKFIPIEHEVYERIVKFENHLVLDRKKSLLLPDLLIESVKEIPEIFDKGSIYLDQDKLSGELRLRRWKEGDKIASIGVKGSQLISKILHDAKVAKKDREDFFVLCDDVDIHWCPNLKVGRNAIASTSTNRILKCSLIYKESV
ncbi:MAG: tRNA lysidine(34) synthetase TilS [Crocinitomicaceae bacterium]